MTPLAATLRARPDADAPAVAAVVADLEARYGRRGETSDFMAPVWLAYDRAIVAAVALASAEVARPEVRAAAALAVELVLMIKGLELADVKPTPEEARP